MNLSALMDKAKGLLKGKGDVVNKGVDKASGLAHKASKGRFDDKIDMVSSKAKDAAAKLTGEAESTADAAADNVVDLTDRAAAEVADTADNIADTADNIADTADNIADTADAARDAASGAADAATDQPRP